MKKTTTYLAVTVTEGGKHVSFVLPVSGSDNLMSVLARVNGLSAANICATKKDAAQLAEFWNECYKANGTYMYTIREEATA